MSTSECLDASDRLISNVRRNGSRSPITFGGIEVGKSLSAHGGCDEPRRDSQG
jgi:hypothetical protein